MDARSLTPRDRLGAGLVRLIGALPESVQRVLGGRPVQIDGQELDPEIKLILKLLELSPEPSIENLTAPDARSQIKRLALSLRGPVLHVDRAEPLEIPGPAGPIPARLYVADAAAGPPPLLVYFHGGGWVVCDLDTHDNACRFLAREAGVAVLSVDYRLAPEDKFPAAVEDALAAYDHATESAAGLGVDGSAIAVGGDSAGANLGTVVSQLARDGGIPAPAFQLLIYPVTDLSTKRRSYELFEDGFFLTAAHMDWYRDHYLPDLDAALDPRASPLLTPDLSGLPPAYIATAGFDVLRDEGEEYAHRLRDAGVPVALRRHSSFIHGIATRVGFGGAGQKMMLEACAALRMGLAGALATTRAS
jgi:acetyl esterase